MPQGKSIPTTAITPEGDVLPGQMLAVAGPNGYAGQVTTSDSGVFQLLDVPAGTYQVGIGTRTETVEVLPYDAYGLDLDTLLDDAGRFATPGPLATRPAATAYGRGVYFALDDNGGTLYVSDGTTWRAASPGAAAASGALLARYGTSTAFSTGSTTYVDVPGLTALAVTGWGGDIDMHIDLPLGSSATTSRTIVRIVDDLGLEVLAWPTAFARSDGSVWLKVTRTLPLLAAGVTRTYRVQMLANGGGTARLDAAGTNPAAVTFRRA